MEVLSYIKNVLVLIVLFMQIVVAFLICIFFKIKFNKIQVQKNAQIL